MKKSFSESFLYRKTQSTPTVHIQASLSNGDKSSAVQKPAKKPGDFVKVKLLGKGDVGKVYLVVDVTEQDRPLFAMKILSKTEMVTRNKVHRVLTEQKLMIQTTHPFIVSLKSTFQSASHLYLCLEYCAGGELFKYLQSRPNKRLMESEAKFYIAEVVCALEYLHLLGFIYRDLKPENILIHASGHIKLADFDLCKASVINSDPSIIKNTFMGRQFTDQIDTKASASVRTNSFVGTEEYMAPEIVKGKDHSSSVDWWTLGVLLYEMLTSVTPFKGKFQKDTFRNILHASPDLSGLSSNSAKSLVKKLLVKNPSKRLGGKFGAIEVKTHSFFKDTKWSLLRDQTPPMVPKLASKYDTHYFRDFPRDENEDEINWASLPDDDSKELEQDISNTISLYKSSSLTALRPSSGRKAGSHLRHEISPSVESFENSEADISQSEEAESDSQEDPFYEFETFVK